MKKKTKDETQITEKLLHENTIPYFYTKMLIRIERNESSFTEVYKITEYFIDQTIEKEVKGKIHFFDPIVFI